MNFLIIEDDSFKNDALSIFVKSIFEDITITSATDVVSAIKIINDHPFDLIIIDMALPSHPIVSGGGAPMSLLTGGLEVLLELHSLDRHDKCVIVTQYSDIEIAGKLYGLKHAAKAIREYISCEVISCIQYIQDSPEWKKELTKVLKLL